MMYRQPVTIHPSRLPGLMRQFPGGMVVRLFCCGDTRGVAHVGLYRLTLFADRWFSSGMPWSGVVDKNLRSIVTMLNLSFARDRTVRSGGLLLVACSVDQLQMFLRVFGLRCLVSGWRMKTVEEMEVNKIGTLSDESCQYQYYYLYQLVNISIIQLFTVFTIGMDLRYLDRFSGYDHCYPHPVYIRTCGILIM